MVELSGGVGEAIEDDHAVVASVIVGVHDEREKVAEGVDIGRRWLSWGGGGVEGWDGTGGGSIFREGFGRELVWFGVEKFLFLFFISVYFI